MQGGARPMDNAIRSMGEIVGLPSVTKRNVRSDRQAKAESLSAV
jgi:hypothetical protein